jgi:hypothetical protein
MYDTCKGKYNNVSDLRLSQQSCWRFVSLGIWRSVARFVVSDVSDGRIAFIFKGQGCREGTLAQQQRVTSQKTWIIYIKCFWFSSHWNPEILSQWEALNKGNILCTQRLWIKEIFCAHKRFLSLQVEKLLQKWTDRVTATQRNAANVRQPFLLCLMKRKTQNLWKTSSGLITPHSTARL